MPYNGSGTYTAPANSWNPAVGGTTVDSADWNSTQSDYETAFSSVITRDGQSNPTANLPMAGFKHTGVNPNSGSTSRTEYASGATLQDGAPLDAGYTGGTDTAYTATLTPAIAAYADKQCFRVIFNADSGATPTINFNSVGPKKMYRNVSGVATQVTTGDILANLPTFLRYDSTLDSSAGGFWVMWLPPDSDDIPYDNSTSGLLASNVQAAIDALVLPGYLYGLTLSNAADTEHDITVATGRAVDGTGVRLMVLASAITKQSDATFAEGTNQGGMVSGESLPTSGTIHWWLISKADGTIDVCCNNNASSGLNPTLPTGFVSKRRIASCRTNSSANIINFTQRGDVFTYSTEVADVIGGTGSAGGALLAISVPTGIAVLATVICNLAGANVGLLTSPDSPNIDPASNQIMNIWSVTGVTRGMQVMLMTNTSSQIRERLAGTYNLDTIGYIDTRGKNE